MKCYSHNTVYFKLLGLNSRLLRFPTDYAHFHNYTARRGDVVDDVQLLRVVGQYRALKTASMLLVTEFIPPSIIFCVGLTLKPECWDEKHQIKDDKKEFH